MTFGLQRHLLWISGASLRRKIFVKVHVHLVFVKLSFLKTTFCSPLTPPPLPTAPKSHYLASPPKFAHCGGGGGGSISLMYQRSELAQNKRTIISSYPDDGSPRKRDFDKRLPGTFQHDIPYSFCPFSSYLCTLQKCIPALEVSKVPKDRMSQKMPPCKIYQVRASTKLFLHFEIRRFLGINWQY